MTKMSRKNSVSLDSVFLKGQIDPIWPLLIVMEASSHETVPALYSITPEELKALCAMHNSMNNSHLSPEFSADGNLKSMILSKLAKQA